MSVGFVDLDKIIDDIQKEYNIVYDKVQIDAIGAAAASKFMVLTGGPGREKPQQPLH